MARGLNKAGLAEARRLAESAMARKATLQEAKDEAYRHGMWVLDNSRDRRVWRIADEMERIINNEGPNFYAKKGA